MAKRNSKISSHIKKQITKPVRVKFYTGRDKIVSFKIPKKITRPVKVKFYAKEK